MGNLFEHQAIDMQRWQPLIDSPLHNDAALDHFGVHAADQALQDGVDRHRTGGARADPGMAEQAADPGLHAVDFGHDVAGKVIAPVAGLSGHQVRRAANGSHRIAQVVRNRGSHLADRGKTFVAGDTPLLVEHDLVGTAHGPEQAAIHQQPAAQRRDPDQLQAATNGVEQRIGAFVDLDHADDTGAFFIPHRQVILSELLLRHRCEDMLGLDVGAGLDQVGFNHNFTLECAIKLRIFFEILMITRIVTRPQYGAC